MAKSGRILFVILLISSPDNWDFTFLGINIDSIVLLNVEMIFQ